MTTENTNETEVELEVETLEAETIENTEDAKTEETKKDEVEVIIEEEEKEDPYQDRYMRLHAEFDNYRRRTAKEQLAMIERANGKLLGEFTEVVENFDRALSTEGQNNLATMYFSGKGVPQNYILAHMWFNLAAASSQAEEKTKKFLANRDLAASKMTAAQIELAQRMASECQASNFKKCTVPK